MANALEEESRKLGRTGDFKRNQLIGQGALTGCLHYLANGRVFEAERSDRGLVGRVIYPGMVFGVEALAAGNNNVGLYRRALEDCQVISVRRESLDSPDGKATAITAELLPTLAESLLQSYHVNLQNMTDTVIVRLARTLCILARTDEMHGFPEDRATVNLLKQEELGGLIFSVRENVNHELKRLMELNLIERKGRGRITAISIPTLNDFVFRNTTR